MTPQEVGTAIGLALQCLVFSLQQQKGIENVLVTLADEIGELARAGATGLPDSTVVLALRSAEKVINATEM